MRTSRRGEQKLVLALLAATVLLWLGGFTRSVCAQSSEQDSTTVEQNALFVIQFGPVVSNVGVGGVFGVQMAKRQGVHFGGRATGGIRYRGEYQLTWLPPPFVGGSHWTTEYAALAYYAAPVGGWLFRIGAGPAYVEEREVDVGTSKTFGIAISGYVGRVFSTYGSFGLVFVANANDVRSFAGPALTLSFPIGW